MALEETDLRRDDGLVRKLGFEDGEVAVVDVSPDVLTVNWTSSWTASQFVDLASHEPAYQTADAIVCMAAEDLEVDMEGLSRLTKDNHSWVDQSWDIVRLDLSDTRSVAWERLPGGAIVVGFGDEASCMRGGLYSEAAQQLEWLLSVTGTGRIGVAAVVENAVKLSQLWAHVESEGEHLAASETEETQAKTNEEWWRHEPGF
ncbi:hypothetical protein [Paenarthrobacter nicotinovorans]|uniref:hypothetical protein n=1 Tax=Paenarthrobacter nicotinovorans TaxID=29320 RepID=UPI003DA31932